MNRVRPLWLFALSLPCLPLPARGDTLSGTILDPQRLVVVGAKVVLRCTDDEATTTTDSQGRFRVAITHDFSGCTLSVTHLGFAPFQATAEGAPVPWEIELQLGVVEEVADVVAEVPRPFSSGAMGLASASLSHSELQALSDDTSDFLDYARAVAGTTLRQDKVYVDGLPSHFRPPPATIARIHINADPFSAEYGECDVNQIHIETQPPERRFQYDLGGGFLGAGGHNTLDPEASSSSRSVRLGLSGPFPLPGLTFSLHANLSHAQLEQPIVAATEVLAADTGENVPGVAPSTSRAGSFLFRAHRSNSERLRFALSLFASQAKSSNANVGAWTLPEAGIGTTFGSFGAQGNVEVEGKRLLYRTGVVASWTGSNLKANSRSLGVLVPDSLQYGGHRSPKRKPGRRVGLGKASFNRGRLDPPGGQDS